MPKRKTENIAYNRRARHEYDIIETFEAGIVLSGCEVRSLRENHAQMTDCFALVRHGEVWLHNLHISPFSMGNINNVDPDRKRKLLLHRRQIDYLSSRVDQRGMALVPLRIYFNEKALAKIELALCRGKKLYDKRRDLKEREVQRDISRALKEHGRY